MEEELVVILDELNYIPEYQEHEKQRQENELVRIANEETRIANETERIEYHEELKEAVERGDFKGEQGEQGLQGEAGEPGATFTPSVDEEGNLSWTNDKGLENPETINIRGPQGEGGGGSSSKEIIEITGSSSTPYILNSLKTGDYVTILAGAYVKYEDTNSIQISTNLPNYGVWVVSDSDLNYGIVMKHIGKLSSKISSNTGNNIIHAKISFIKNGTTLTGPSGLVPDEKYYETLGKLAVVTTNDAQTINGVKTFSALPKTSINPTDNLHLTNKQYVDTQLATKQDVLTAGENITIEGNVISAIGGGGSGGECPTIIIENNQENPLNLSELNLYDLIIAKDSAYVTTTNNTSGAKFITQGIYWVTLKSDSEIILKGIYQPNWSSAKNNIAMAKSTISLTSTAPSISFVIYNINEMLVNDSSSKMLYGSWSFAQSPISSSTPTADNQLVNKAYVDGIAPTKTSDLTNDSGYITSESVPIDLYGGENSSSEHKITFGTEDPSGGSHGDIYFKYSL